MTREHQGFSLCLSDSVVRAALKSRLNSLRQRPKIRHSLQFIIRQFNAEMLLDARKQIERLQTINAKRLEKIVVRRKLLARHLEVRSRETQYLIQCLICSLHIFVTAPFKSQITNYEFRAGTAAAPHSLQTSAILLQLRAANRARKKCRSRALTPHTESASQISSPPPSSHDRIFQSGWQWRAPSAVPRLRRQSGSPSQSAAPSSH